MAKQHLIPPLLCLLLALGGCASTAQTTEDIPPPPPVQSEAAAPQPAPAPPAPQPDQAVPPQNSTDEEAAASVQALSISPIDLVGRYNQRLMELDLELDHLLLQQPQWSDALGALEADTAGEDELYVLLLAPAETEPLTEATLVYRAALEEEAGTWLGMSAMVFLLSLDEALDETQAAQLYMDMLGQLLRNGEQTQRSQNGIQYQLRYSSYAGISLTATADPAV